MRASYLAAWLLPLLVGTGVFAASTATTRFRGKVAAVLGGGWLFGVLLAALLARWTARADTLHALARATPWLLGVAAAAWLAAFALRLGGRRARTPRTTVGDRGWRSESWRSILAWTVLLVLVAVRLAMLADEASLRPFFPWDAWSVWAAKPKAWLLLGHADPFVSMHDWLTQAQTRNTMAWNYPEWLAWVQVWFASGAGGWNEPLVGVAWSGALAAFALAAYGYFRGFGVSRLPAMALVYALVSLPLLDAHAALAGYADLWLALVCGLAALVWTRWLLFREPGQWWLAVAIAMALPGIKLEGAIWLCVFAVVAALELMSRRWRWPLLGALAAAVVSSFFMGGFWLPLPTLGWTHLAWGRVSFAALGSFPLSFHNVGDALVASLFTLPNWHLFWYALPLLAAARWRVLATNRAARVVGTLLLVDLLVLIGLFFLTDAAAWAADYTSANRLFLQLVPLALVFAALLMRGAGTNRRAAFSSALPGRARASTPPMSRA